MMMIMITMMITLRILQITKQRGNYNHCSELFTDINIVLKLIVAVFYDCYPQQLMMVIMFVNVMLAIMFFEV